MSVFHIAVREVRALMTSTVGWLVLAGFLLVSGGFWVLMVLAYDSAFTDQVFDPYAPYRLTFSGSLLGPWFGNLSVILVMALPAVSMRSFSEELDRGTLELLLTSPVSSLEIVAGKYIGTLCYVCLLLLCTSQAPVSLYFLGAPDLGLIAAAYLGLLGLSSALVALGLFVSSLTSNQVVAFVITFALGLGLYLPGAMDPGAGDSWQQQLSLAGHLLSPLEGALRLSDLVYFGSFTAVFLFACWQRVEGFRWR